MLDLFGSEYIIDHCVSEIKHKQKLNLLQVYVTDALKLIAENTAKFAGGNYLTMRFDDILNPKEEEDKRTDKEIISDILQGLAELEDEDEGGE